tara:strand:- start:8883 stop:9131 length:249 start_codon:yes stop_codon:yes gene_type:complete
MQKKILQMSEKIAVLEASLAKSNEAITDLSSCVASITQATQGLSYEMTTITTILQQATEAVKKESDILALKKLKDDDDGYLN